MQWAVIALLLASLYLSQDVRPIAFLGFVCVLCLYDLDRVMLFANDAVLWVCHFPIFASEPSILRRKTPSHASKEYYNEQVLVRMGLIRQ